MPDPSLTVFDDVGHLVDANGSPASRWLIETFVPMATDAAGGPNPPAMDGQLLQQWWGMVDWSHRERVRNQQFRIVPLDATAGIFYLVADHSGRVADIFTRGPAAVGQPDRGRGQGSSVGLWALTFAPWQLWTFTTRPSDDRLMIVSLMRDPDGGQPLVWDVRGASRTAGAGIQVWTPLPADANQWFKPWRVNEAGNVVAFDPAVARQTAGGLAALAAPGLPVGGTTV
jgi:hypothetical protein